MSDFLQPHELQHARPPCPSPTPRVHPNSVHWVGDAIQPSHSLSSPSPPAFNLSSIRVFSNESPLHIRWPKYWSFSFNISPSNEHSGLISFRMDWSDLLIVQGTLKSLLQHHSSKASIFWHSAFFIVQFSHPYMTTGKTIALRSIVKLAKSQSGFYSIYTSILNNISDKILLLAMMDNSIIYFKYKQCFYLFKIGVCIYLKSCFKTAYQSL